MLGASLGLLLAILGTTEGPQPAELVAELGSHYYARREAAEVALEKLGRVALPALRAARKSKDPEIQTRVLGLISRIEESLLVEPTLVTLDFDDAPVEQALKRLADQSGMSLVLNPMENAAIQGRRLTCRSTGPVSFWKAIDTLCESGRLHYLPGGQLPLGQKEGTILFQDGRAREGEPVFDSGPFRVSVGSFVERTEIQPVQRSQPFGGRTRFTAPGESLRTNPNLSRQFSMQLQVSCEPRLSIAQNGLAKVTVAVDDKGQSLISPPGISTYQHMAGYSGMIASPMVRLRVDLLRPESAGQKIRLLRGMIPITVATRKPDPLEVSIEGSVGKVFRNDEVAISIQSTRAARGGATSMIELSITQRGQAPRPMMIGEGEPLGYRPDAPQQQIEILDAKGNSLAWFPSGTFYNGEETRLALTIVNRDKPPVPALIRYHSLIRTVTEIPFEYRNLPMP